MKNLAALVAAANVANAALVAAGLAAIDWAASSNRDYSLTIEKPMTHAAASPILAALKAAGVEAADTAHGEDVVRIWVRC